MSDHTEHVTICFFRFVVIDANFWARTRSMLNLTGSWW